MSRFFYALRHVAYLLFCLYFGAVLGFCIMRELWFSAVWTGLSCYFTILLSSFREDEIDKFLPGKSKLLPLIILLCSFVLSIFIIGFEIKSQAG